MSRLSRTPGSDPATAVTYLSYSDQLLYELRDQGIPAIGSQHVPLRYTAEALQSKSLENA